MAKRLENVLPEIIHFDQSAFVKGRTIFDAIRTIDDMIEHTMNRDISGVLVAIDFEKAFDSLNVNFLLRALHAFNFGPSFIQWGVYFGGDAKKKRSGTFGRLWNQLRKRLTYVNGEAYLL